MSTTVDKLYEKAREYNAKSEMYSKLADELDNLARYIKEFENE